MVVVGGGTAWGDDWCDYESGVEVESTWYSAGAWCTWASLAYWSD